VSGYTDAENIFGEYTKQSEHQITELNKIIIALRTKVSILEKGIKEQEKIPVPRTIINQIIELEQKNRKLKEELNFYIPHISENVKAKRNKQLEPTRKGGLR
jgi:hypothetical protein